jgi:4-hydroxyphenylpyruvate dioxygenase-like putative hemolysin
MQDIVEHELVRAQAVTPLTLSANIIGIDHIAVAVPDLQAAIEWAKTRLGCQLIEERETTGAHSGMKSAVLGLGGFVVVFVQGTGKDSQITQYVERHGPGIQHVALRVQHIGEAISALEANQFAFSTPRLDSKPLSQIFSVRDPATNMMIELIERRNYTQNPHELLPAQFCDSLSL